MSSNAPRAALLGAFDRFNYGDLLFPIVARNEIRAHQGTVADDAYALVASDLSRYGALPTRSLRDMYRDLKAGDAVIFAGGGTVGVDWYFMLSNLLGPQGNKLLAALPRVIGYRMTERLCRNYFGARAPFPWVAGPQDFPVPVNVAYNAVGGSELGTHPAAAREATLQRLAQAAYLSVRDTETQRVFSPVEDRVKVHVSPDSAILMSEQFPVPWLREHASRDTLAVLDETPYLCFHANQGYINRHKAQIVEALHATYEAHRLPVVLLPIGRYHGLDDHLGLTDLQRELKIPSRMVSSEANLWEIMLSVAQSQLFLGTSLHGAVTSQSFGVPHLGLSERVHKLDYYLGTWDLPEQADCVKLRDVPDRVTRALAVSAERRQDKRQELIRLAHENFARLMTACRL